MSSRMPWDEIATPDHDFNVLLARPGRPVPVFWGKDESGQCLLIVELAGDHRTQFGRDRTAVTGINIDLRQKSGADRQHLVLSLEKQVDRDLFLALCETLIVSLDPVTEAAVALAVALAHLKRWKAFLSGRDPRLLSPEEVRGLFAELQFLQRLLASPMAENDAIDSWQGADRAQHDFSFSNTAVEIKALTGKERNSVRISSEDQLESLNDNLFLRIYRLSVMPEADQAISLNMLVNMIETALKEAASIERFTASLAAYGYGYMLDYDQPRFVVTDIRSYRIADGFPRLVRSELPDGVMRVAYDIQLESIDKFRCENDAELGGK